VFYPPPPQLIIESHKADSDEAYLPFGNFKQICELQSNADAVKFYKLLYSGIRLMRQLRYQSCKDFSEQLGMARNSFARCERKYKSIPLHTFFNICNILHCSPARLFIYANCFDMFTDKNGEFIHERTISERIISFKDKS
jgi:DNA-binding Xre family transcriptional regulator